MGEHRRNDKIQNACSREKVGVVPLEEKMTRSCLRWFGHVRRRSIKTPARRVDHIKVTLINRGRGRPKKTQRETTEKCLDLNSLSKILVFDDPCSLSHRVRKGFC